MKEVTVEEKRIDAEKKHESVYVVTKRIISKLSGLLDTSSGKATLANLRNSIGRPLSSTIDIWPLVFDNLPEEFLGWSGSMSNEEKAILTTLQLFALYQQGKSELITEKAEEKKYTNIGSSFSRIRDDESRLSLDRRFNVLITSDTFEELSHHLRQFIKLLKAKGKGSVEIDFARLSEDLYWFLRGYDEKVRLSWSREYYKMHMKEDKGEENNDKQQ